MHLVKLPIMKSSQHPSTTHFYTLTFHISSVLTLDPVSTVHLQKTFTLTLQYCIGLHYDI